MKKGYRDSCHPIYQLKESEKGFTNDNGCPPSYNRDPFGVCRRCKSQISSKNQTSNCLFFADTYLIKEDYTFNMQNYTEELYAKQIPFKGYLEDRGKQLEASKMTYKTLYFNEDNQSVGLYEGFRVADSTKIYRHQQTPGSEVCYQLSEMAKSSSGYALRPARGFRLEPMSKYPWIDTSQQVAKYPQGALNSTICVKTCPVGEYYEFESLSCRMCDIGCSRCHRVDLCDECVPGYSLVERPKFRELASGLSVGTCVAGCQDEFYAQRYNGRCLECPKGCRVCRDRSKKELGRITDLEKEEVGSAGFCLICGLSPQTNKKIIADRITGKCIESCSGDGKVTLTKERETSTSSFKYQICERCKVAGCKTCPTGDLNNCLGCKAGLYKQTSDGVVQCVKFNDLKNMSIYLAVGVSLAFLLLVCLIAIIIKIIMSQLNSKPSQEKTKKRPKKIIINDPWTQEILKCDPSHVKNDEIEGIVVEETPFHRIRTSTIKSNILGFTTQKAKEQKKLGREMGNELSSLKEAGQRKDLFTEIDQDLKKLKMVSQEDVNKIGTKRFLSKVFGKLNEMKSDLRRVEGELVNFMKEQRGDD